MASRANAMPDLSSFVPIRAVRERDETMPIILTSLHTNSGECRNVAPFYVQLHERFPRLYFLQVSFQPYDDIISNFSNIPELMKLNVSHDAQQQFKKLLIMRNTMAIPHMFVFNAQGTLIFEGHPLSKPIEAHLFRLSGQSVLNNTFRAPSPILSMSMTKSTTNDMQRSRSKSPTRLKPMVMK